VQPPARRSSVQAIERARNFIEWNFPMGVMLRSPGKPKARKDP